MFEGGAATAPDDELRLRPGSRTRWRRLAAALARSPSALLGFVLTGLIVAVAIIAPLLFGSTAQAQNPGEPFGGPSWHHLLGTDELGRDTFLRTLVAVRRSLLVALAASGVGVILGFTIGLVAVALTPRLRNVALRGIDALLAFPGILIAIMVTATLGASTLGAILGVGAALAFSQARLTSTLAMGIAGRDYHDAARVLGVGRLRLMVRHTLPNIAEPLIIGVSVSLSYAIVVVSALSYLGLGVQPPSFDLGTMLTDGMQAIFQTPLAAISPAAAIAIMALAAGLLGDALAQALNPRLWTAMPGAPLRRHISAGRAKRAEDVLSMGAEPARRDRELLEVQHLSVHVYRDGQRGSVVDDVSFAISDGEFVGIVGETGSGKTMTALAIAQLLPYGCDATGHIRFRQQDLGALSLRELDKALARHLSVVFQDPLTSMNPALTVGTQLTLGARRYNRMRRGAAMTRAAERLTEVRLPDARRQLRRYPHELSGGMRQRAMIALGLMMEPALIIADEPTTALDVTVQARITELLREVNQRHGTGVIFISHDIILVGELCDRIIVMYAGQIVEDATAGVLLSSPMHPYTRALLEAVPNIDLPRDGRLYEMPGDARTAFDETVGCPFRPRCPAAVARCSAERPVLSDQNGSHLVACHVVNDRSA